MSTRMRPLWSQRYTEWAAARGGLHVAAASPVKSVIKLWHPACSPEFPVTHPTKLAGGLVCALFMAVLLDATLVPSRARSYAIHYLHLSAGKTGLRLSNDRARNLPHIIFWAWERPEDLRFLAPDRAGVAFLAKTIRFRSGTLNLPENSGVSFAVQSRHQPLEVSPDLPLMAVVRIEVFSGPPPQSYKPPVPPVFFTTTVPNALEDRLSSQIAELQNLPGVAAIQIDFDASTSEHAFYSALLQNVRAKLPASMPLSITALASWCMGDRWLTRLPPGTIDEAVPMLFRMGPDSANVAAFLRSGNDFPVPACRGSLGLSTDESLSKEVLTGKLIGLPSDWREKRIYVFSPRAWSQPAAEKILEVWQP